MMGKRSNFPRRAQDAYDTPASAVKPLLPHLPAAFNYWEPCAGRGALIDVLPGRAVNASDIAPRRDDILPIDAFQIQMKPLYEKAWDYIITNPPWSRPILHDMIQHFAAMRPTWLLFDADWMHTKQAIPHLALCRKIVSVGRVSWMENGTSGMDNCAWYLFDAAAEGETQFVGRAA